MDYAYLDSVQQECTDNKCSTFSKRPHQRNCLHYRGELTQRELQLGDIVDTGGFEGYSTATVRQIKDGIITLFRPYTHSSDFSYTGGVICYVGIEEFSVLQDSDRTFKVLSRTKLK